MKHIGAAVAALAIALAPAPAAAWGDDDGWEAPWSPPEPPEPAQSVPEPTVAEPLDVPAPEPPEGLYRVTETYVGEVIVVEGSRTSYLTETVAWEPGTYARELGGVATGAASPYDGLALNERLTLPDGRAVAGTYYEDWVLGATGFVPVNIVFFQDDSILAMPAAPVAPAAPALPIVEPGITAGGPVASGPTEIDREGAPAPPPASAAPPAPSSVVPRATVALRPGGAPVDRIEVLRGRRIALWPAASVSGVSAALLGWRLVAADGAAVTAVAGAPGEPLIARWDRLAPPGASFPVRLTARVALPGADAALDVPIALEVVVLSPALEP